MFANASDPSFVTPRQDDQAFVKIRPRPTDHTKVPCWVPASQKVRLVPAWCICKSCRGAGILIIGHSDSPLTLKGIHLLSESQMPLPDMLRRLIRCSLPLNSHRIRHRDPVRKYSEEFEVRSHFIQTIHNNCVMAGEGVKRPIAHTVLNLKECRSGNWSAGFPEENLVPGYVPLCHMILDVQCSAIGAKTTQEPRSAAF
jgi:hypothetical protein